jgi:hypothetical protein
LPKENITIPLKLRVFVKASLEAKALSEYFSRNIDQSPAPFVMLSRGLHMVVAYDMTVLDPSDAGVADRFRYDFSLNNEAITRFDDNVLIQKASQDSSREACKRGD